MGVIYLRTNTVNGKQYVGQTVNIRKREKQWNSIGHYAGKAIDAARKKYGIEAFDFEILMECKDEELNQWEMYYIEKLNTKVPYGYNMTDGGDGKNGCPVSEETRKRLSESHKGKQTWCKGRHPSEETRKKMSKAQKGRKHTEESKKKISESRKGEKHWLYGKHPSEETIKKLSEARKGEKNHFYGKHHTQESKEKMSESLKGRKQSEETKLKRNEKLRNGKCSKPVLQINKNTNEVIAEFPSMHQVQRELGFLQGNIGSCCRGERTSAYGFKWRFAV